MEEPGVVVTHYFLCVLFCVLLDGRESLLALLPFSNNVASLTEPKSSIAVRKM